MNRTNDISAIAENSFFFFIAFHTNAHGWIGLQVPFMVWYVMTVFLRKCIALCFPSSTVITLSWFLPLDFWNSALAVRDSSLDLKESSFITRSSQIVTLLSLISSITLAYSRCRFDNHLRKFLLVKIIITEKLFDLVVTHSHYDIHC